MTARGVSVARGHRQAGRRIAVVGALLGALGAACGARLPDDVHQRAAQAVLQPNHAGTLARAGSSGEVSSGLLAPTDAPTQGVVPTGPTDGEGSPAPGATGPATRPTATETGSSASCSGGTDVGLTATTMTLGTIATLSGPISGLFDGAVHGVESFANYVNHVNGGICGRQVKFQVADDGANCTQNQNATTTLVGKAFAQAGSFALYDGCGASVIRAHPDFADVHVALDSAAQLPSNHFDVSAKEPGFATGMFRYYRQKYGAKLDRVGTIVENIPSAIANQKNMVHAAESEGWHFVDSILEQPTNSSFQGDFVKLCQQEHIQVFFELTEPAGNAATMLQNEYQAGCPASLINIFPIAYDQAFLADYAGPKSRLEGLQGWSEYALFFNKDEAANIPEVKLLQDWYQRTYPGVPINLYSLFAWASSRLFEKAANSVEGPLNRKSLLAALRRIRSFDDGGLMAPSDPSSGGPHCYVLFQYRNGGFERVDDPKAGFRCDGKFLRRST